MSSTATGLADTHCHLTLAAFDKDRAGVLERAAEKGVHRILVPGIDLRSSRQAIELAAKHSPIYAAVGVHPHHAQTWNEQLAHELCELAESSKVVAIGEIGLDYYRNLSPRDQQYAAFRGQLEVAAELGLPVIVHSRQAVDEVLAGLMPWSARLAPHLRQRAGVLHAFNDSTHVATNAVDAGFFIGIAGPITFAKVVCQDPALAQLRADRLVVETDAPYLAPHPFRGKRNEPAYVELVARGLAQALDQQYESVAMQTCHNATHLFGW